MVECLNHLQELRQERVLKRTRFYWAGALRLIYVTDNDVTLIG
jgi:hypothetical protein